MITDKEVIQAINTIRQYCEERPNCDGDCPLDTWCGHCRQDGVPDTWPEMEIKGE